jgi:hypothetical protein
MDVKPTAPPEESTYSGDAPFYNINKLLQYNNKPSDEIMQKMQNLTMSSSCASCKENLELSTHPVVNLKCGHALHFKCSKSWMDFSDNVICKKCTKDTPKNEEKIEEEEDIGIPLSYGTDPEVTKKINAKYKIDAITAKIEEIKNEGLSQYTLTNIFDFGWTKLKSKTNITFDVLKEKGITIDKLITARVHAPTLYEHVGVNDFSQLKQLGLRIDHLAGQNFSIIYMKMLYNMDYKALKSEMGLTVKQAIRLCSGKPHYLLLLGLSANELLMHGLSQQTMIKTASAFSQRDWVQKLGLRKKHVVALGFTAFTLEALQWDPFTFSSDMKLSFAETKDMGISMIESIDPVQKKAKNKKTIKTKKQTLLSRFTAFLDDD